MNTQSGPLAGALPIQPAKIYAPAGVCVYCGSNNELREAIERL
jgi:hypothetical protein